jgi:hypothetical protein
MTVPASDHVFHFSNAPPLILDAFWPEIVLTLSTADRELAHMGDHGMQKCHAVSEAWRLYRAMTQDHRKN